MPRDSQQPYEVIGDAIKGHMKQLAQDIEKSETWVNRQGNDPEASYYQRFWQLYEPLHHRNPAGADEIYEDFSARHFALKYGLILRSVCWCDAVGDVAKETAEAIAAAVRSGDAGEIKREVTDGIRALQILLVLIEANGGVPQLTPALAVGGRA